MKLFYAAVAGLMVLAFASCNKDKRALKSPQPLLLFPTHNGIRLSDATLNGTGLYYFLTLNSTHKEFVGDFGRAPGTGYQKGILFTSTISSLSGDEDHKSFYLQFPDGTIDTLLVDYGTLSDKDARENACFCKHPQTSVLVNGHPAAIAFYNTDSVPVYHIYK